MDRFKALVESATNKAMRDELKRDLGNPRTMREAQARWDKLPEFSEGQRCRQNRLHLELTYGDEVEF